MAHSNSPTSCGKLEPFTISATTALFLNATISSKLDLGRNPVALRGDVVERAAQTAQLFAQGVGVGQLDQGGLISKQDLPRAMEIIWNFKPPGWQHYELEFVQLRLCTPSEFTQAKA